jgi:hypothetical protein
MEDRNVISGSDCGYTESEIRSSEVAASSGYFRKFAPAAWLLAALFISLAYSWHYLPFVMDDALISYRYSDRLLHGLGLTWNDGEFVEGYSNLLWVLLVAAGGVVQPNLIVVGWVLGLLANVAVLVAIAWTFGRSTGSAVVPLAGGLLVLALSGSFAVWGVGGLETALVGALVAWALAMASRMSADRWSWSGPGLLLGLLAITRPDGVAFAAGVALAMIVRDGVSRVTVQRSLGLVVFPAVFTAGQLAFRVAYYGSLVPNTAYAKLAFTLARIWAGAVYLAQGAVVNSVPLVAIVILVIVLIRARQWQPLRQAAVFLVPGLIWLLYVGAIGGDIFPGHRHWMPALVCFAFALSSLLTAFPVSRPLLLGSGLAVAAGLHLATQSVDSESRLRWLERLTWQGIAIGQFMHDAFGPRQPLLAVDAAGCLPFGSRLPALDMLGLTDFHIARHRPPDMGAGLLGHELGDGAYVLSRKPDIVEFCMPTGSATPCFRGERELAALPDFRRDYRLVFYGVGAVDAAFWTRIEDGRLGIVRTTNAIYIPGFLLATTPNARAVLHKGGEAVAALKGGGAAIERIYIPKGTWDVSLETDTGSHLQLATAPAADTTVLRPDVLRIASSGTARSFRVFGGQGVVYAIRAKRLAE